MVRREHRQTTVIGCVTPANVYILWNERSARLSERMERHAPYRAPEQSGRLNRVSDARSDLYSLGVIYYELLTGQLPIRPERDEDWDSAHILQAPRPLSELRPEVGEPLQGMIMKLLAKSPDDRYQSAYGVLDDLQRCQNLLGSIGKLVPFEIGLLDASRLFRPSGFMYGRSDAIRQLEAGLEQAAGGAPAFRWLTGGEGSGKTALAQAFRLTVAQQGGRFVEGTVSHSQQAAPYEPYLQALRQLIQQLWSEPGELVKLLKERLRAEFGQEARMIVSLLPEAGPLFDCQADTPSEADKAMESMSFEQLLPRLIRFFAACTSPLVLFIDHLERADAGTIAVLHTLALDPTASGLLVIGASRTYRNETARNDAAAEENLEQTRAPAISWLSKRIRAHPAEEIALLPLGYEEVRQVVADALHDHSALTRVLARAVYNRTGGSPQAVKLLLETWIREKQLMFDDRARRWTWDAEVVRLTSDSAVDIERMEASFGKLPYDTKALLAMAAVIGSSFRLSLLSEAYGCTTELTLHRLREAEVEGIIGHVGESESGDGIENMYLFLHDHLHQLAYAFDAERNAQRHWRVGKLLQAQLREGGDASLPTAVDHLNLGVHAMPEQEKRQLAVHNLQASLKAMEDGQYVQGKRYAEAGLRLVEEEPKELVPETVYVQLKVNWAWAMYMCGHSEPAQISLLDLLERGGKLSRTEHLQIWTPLIQFHTFANDGSAVQYGQKALQDYGWSFKEKPSLLSIAKEVMQTQLFLYRKRGKLQTLQSTHHDEEYVALCGLMLRLAFPMMLQNAEALIELYARFIRYGIRTGINESLICIIGAYESLLQRVLPNYAQVEVFAELADRHDMDLSGSHFKYRYAFISGISNQLKDPVEASLYLEQALRRGMEAGDIDFVNMAVITCLITHNGDLYALDELLDYFAKHVRRYASDKTLEIAQIAESYAAALREESALERFIAIPESASGVVGAGNEKEEEEEDNYSYCCKLEAACLAGRYREALYWAGRGRTNELAADWGRIRKHRVYESLALAALYPKASVEERKRIRLALRAHLRKMAKWKGIFGVNSIAHRLMKAEWERISGKSLEALREYMAAVKQARSEKNGLMEGIACERLALYYEQDMISRSGAMIAMMDACTAYSVWGVTSKVTQIRTRHAELLQVVSKPYEIQGRVEGDRPRIRLPQPDHAAAREDEKSGDDELLEQIVNGVGTRRSNWQESFLEAALRQSGAERGVVLSCGENGFAIEALSDMPSDGETSELYAESVARHAAMTNEPVVLPDALQSYFVKDAYISSCRPRSVLCMAIAVPGARASFIVYLENRHVPGVFANRDLNVLELIATRTIYFSMLDNEAAAVSETTGAEDRAGKDLGSLDSASASSTFVEPLTGREIEILSALAEGLSNKEIAERFGIAESTVKTHTTRIFGKLGVKRRGQAVALAKQRQMIE
ncbi:AAA family ATPase [Cohnella soli]|uniref:AAA family ATPase n=1 Tax=Cohnella soli TaxID=425005 RepID=A0ABW0HWM5_9BACL